MPHVDASTPGALRCTAVLLGATLCGAAPHGAARAAQHDAASGIKTNLHALLMAIMRCAATWRTASKNIDQLDN